MRPMAKNPIEKFMSPGEMMGGQTHGIGWGERNYHPGKKAGGTTDYGDYNILVLEHLAEIAEPTQTVQCRRVDSPLDEPP